MAGKFNMDFIKGVSAAKDSDLENGIADKFRSTAEIFDKANATIDTIPLHKLIPYSNHPFKIREGERLDELTESLKEQGILVPLIVRCHADTKGSYEILAGHHRHEAAKRAGIDKLPCIIKNVDDNVAALIVVASNKQRGFSDMLPSEIAKALKLEYDALKCQGKRTDLMAQLDDILKENFTENMPINADDTEVCGTLCPMGTKLDNGDSVGKNNDLSRRDTFRYIRLNSLIYPLLELVDDGTIAIRPAVDLSFLTESEQFIVSDLLDTTDYKLDMKKTEKIKEYSQLKKLTQDTALLIISGAIFEIKEKKATAIKLPYKKIKSYVDTSLSPAELEKYVLRALEFYKNNGGDKDES